MTRNYYQPQDVRCLTSRDPQTLTLRRHSLQERQVFQFLDTNGEPLDLQGALAVTFVIGTEPYQFAIDDARRGIVGRAFTLAEVDAIAGDDWQDGSFDLWVEAGHWRLPFDHAITVHVL